MTAIAGLWRFDGSGGVRADAERMSRVLAVFGPHRDGLHEDSKQGLAFAWRQFRVTAEDSFDRQPLIAENGALWLVADARIDNCEELAVQLGLPASGPDRPSDAGFILAAYKRWGPDCACHLSGDFAFALWDGKAERLLLARDAIGMRPLYFAKGEGFFAFASMPRGLFGISGISDTLDEEEINAYLALLPAEGTKTFFREIFRIPPGHLLAVSGQKIEIISYWHPENAPALPRGDYREYVEEFRRLYRDAVRSQLRAPSGSGIASQLSAGYDSSSVTALAAQVLAEQGKRLTAFTAAPRAGFKGAYRHHRLLDESKIAASVAARYDNIDHRVVRTGPVNPLHCLDQILPYLDGPFLNPCNLIWLSAIATQAAESGARVLLSGQLGNMTVSYDGISYLARLFGQGRWIALARHMAGRWRDGASFKSPFGAALSPYLPLWLLTRLRPASFAGADITQYTALSQKFTDNALVLAKARGWNLEYRPWRDGKAMRLAVLRRVDVGPVYKAYLARYGVDTRDPTVERRLVDFCLALPEQHYIRGGRTSSVFRDAMAGVLPEPMLARRSRGYQGADWYESVVAARGDIAAELDRLEASPLAGQALDVGRLRQALAELPDPETPPEQLPAWLSSNEAIYRFRLAMLRGVSVGKFIRRVEGGNG